MAELDLTVSVPDLRRDQINNLPLQSIWRDSRSRLLGAKVGNGLSCFVEGCQQGVCAVLRLYADLLVGQVNIELHSSQFVEDSRDGIGTALTSHVHGELVLRHD